MAGPLKNERHEKAVQAFMENGQNQSAAFLVGYPNSIKWKKDSIWQRASKLFAEAKVQSRVKELQERLAKKEIITKEFIIEDLKKISEITIMDYISEFDAKTETITYKPLEEWTTEMRKACNGFKPGKFGLEITVYGVTFAYTRLCKMLGFDAPTEIKAEVQGTIADMFKPQK